MFLRALGIAVTNDDIIELLGNSDVIKRTLELSLIHISTELLRVFDGTPHTNGAHELVHGLRKRSPQE